MILKTFGKTAASLLVSLALVPVAHSREGHAEFGNAQPLNLPPPYATQKAENVQDDTLRVHTNLVTVLASVMDRDGRYITDLQREDFQLFEDGIEQDLSFFAPVNSPFTILFLLDVSGSMGGHIDELAHASNTFLHQLHPEDQLIAASFDARVEVLCELSKVKDVRGTRRFALRVAKDRSPITMVYDAVNYALKRMKKINGRKAIVLFSDGIGSGRLSTAKENLRAAEEQGAQIYTVQFNTSNLSYAELKLPKMHYKRMLQEVETANNYMRDLAAKTGGRHYPIQELVDLEQTFGFIAEELSRQYSLGYYPKGSLEPGQKRQLKVKVRRPNLAVRARDSYLVKPSP